MSNSDKSDSCPVPEKADNSLVTVCENLSKEIALLRQENQKLAQKFKNLAQLVVLQGNQIRAQQEQVTSDLEELQEEFGKLALHVDFV